MQDDNTLPEKFVQKILQLFSKPQAKQILHSFSQAKPVTLRVNTLRESNTTAIDELRSLGFELNKVDWYTYAYILKNKSKRELTETTAFTQGRIYIQNLSSMMPAISLDPQPGDTILDLCAAPGSKTTQMAMHMQNTGQIVANDMSRQRMFALKRNLNEQGVTNTKVTCMPGQILWKHYLNFFDKTLVDVPCSMEGRFLTTDPKTYEDWTQKKVKILSQKQKYLLRSAITATKPGGTIVYSTCTISPEENTGVIEWILQKETGVELVEEKQILPTPTMEAFFIAKLRKL